MAPTPDSLPACVKASGTPPAPDSTTPANTAVGGPGAAPEDEISLRQIEAFLIVAEERSITRAAERMHLSQPGLSRVIVSLESTVGQRLFTRGSGQMRPTPFAMQFMPYARRLLGSYSDTLGALQELRDQPIVLATCELLMADVIRKLPHTRDAAGQTAAPLQIQILASHEVMELVASGRAQAGLCICGDRRDDLAFLPLLNLDVGLLAPATLPLPDPIQSLRDLEHLTMVRLPDHMTLPHMLHARQVDIPAYFQARLTANSMGAVCSAVRAGQHATLVSALAAAAAEAHGLRFVPLPHLLPAMQVCLVRRPEAMADNATRALEVALSQCVREVEWPEGVEHVASGA